MLAFASFLGQRILRATLGWLTPVTHNVEDTVLGWWQGGEGFLDSPCHLHKR